MAQHLLIQKFQNQAEGQTLVFFIKTVCPAEQPAGCERPAIVVIASVNQGQSGRIFVSGLFDILGEAITGKVFIDVDLRLHNRKSSRTPALNREK